MCVQSLALQIKSLMDVDERQAWPNEALYCPSNLTLLNLASELLWSCIFFSIFVCLLVIQFINIAIAIPIVTAVAVVIALITVIALAGTFL